MYAIRSYYANSRTHLIFRGNTPCLFRHNGKSKLLDLRMFLNEGIERLEIEGLYLLQLALGGADSFAFIVFDKRPRKPLGKGSYNFV